MQLMKWSQKLAVPPSLQVTNEPDVRAVFPNGGAQRGQVLWRRLGRAREPPVGCRVDPDDLGAQRLEQPGPDDGPGPVAGVEHDAHPLVPGRQRAERLDDGGHVEVARPRHRLDLANPRAPHLRVIALIVDVEQLATAGGAQEQSVRADELQRVPLGRIVAGGDGDPAGGAQASHEELHG